MGKGSELLSTRKGFMEATVFASVDTIKTAFFVCHLFGKICDLGDFTEIMGCECTIFSSLLIQQAKMSQLKAIK